MNIDWAKVIAEVIKYAEGYTSTTPTPIDDLVVRLLKAALEKKFPSFGASPGEVGAESHLDDEQRAALSGILKDCETGSDPG